MIITSIVMTIVGNNQVSATTVCSPPANENPAARVKELNEKLTILLISNAKFDSLDKLTGTVPAYVAAGRIYGVDPALMLAITLHETAYGTAEPFTKGNNPGGIKPPSGLQGYSTLEHGVLDFARLLRNLYISEGRTTPETIANKYAPPTSERNRSWPSGVSKFLKELGGTTYTCTVQSVVF